MAKIKVRLDLRELKRVMRVFDFLGLCVYGSVYDKNNHMRHEACMDYDYQTIKTLATKTARFGEPPFVPLYSGPPARGPGRPKGSKNKPKKARRR
jgi:hypothetical protein